VAHVVIAWEIGRGFGHLVPLVAVGLALRRRGHKVTTMVHDDSKGAPLLASAGLHVVTLPRVPAPTQSFPLSDNYTANLLRNGFWDAATVTARVKQWRQALAGVHPELLICDHAPSVLLATRGAGHRRLALGTGFTVPPLATPMPALQPWFSLPPDRLEGVDRTWISVTNDALRSLALPKVTSVSDLFEGVDRRICIEPELDHYSERTGDSFVGAVTARPWLAARLMDEAEPYVFVYLSRTNRYLVPVLEALVRLQWRSLVYVAGLVADDRDILPRSSALTYLDKPIDLSGLDGRCRLAISHGGTQTASIMLKAGVPLLVCPEDLEKAVLGARLSAQGLATSMNWFAPCATDLVPVIERAIAIAGSEACVRFARTYRPVTADVVEGRLMDLCDQLLESGNA
jgi:hypothetical protein